MDWIVPVVLMYLFENTADLFNRTMEKRKHRAALLRHGVFIRQSIQMAPEASRKTD